MKDGESIPVQGVRRPQIVEFKKQLGTKVGYPYAGKLGNFAFQPTLRARLPFLQGCVGDFGADVAYKYPGGWLEMEQLDTIAEIIGCLFDK